jgi:hypothetical protein
VLEGDIVTVSAQVSAGMNNVRVGTFTFTATSLGNTDYALPEDPCSPSYTITPLDVTITGLEA